MSDQLGEAVEKALDALIDVMDVSNSKQMNTDVMSVKVQAARAVLEYAGRNEAIVSDDGELYVLDLNTNISRPLTERERDAVRSHVGTGP